jgi:hypothetical protein
MLQVCLPPSQHFSRDSRATSRPASLAHLGAQLLGEVRVGGGVLGGSGRQERAGADFGQRPRCVADAVRRSSAAGSRPIAQVIGDAPDQLDVARAQSDTCRAAARRKFFRGSRAAPGSTTRNWPPPLDPSKGCGPARAPPAARAAALRTISVIHCDRPASRSSPAERAERPSAARQRNSPVPRILPCSRICSDIRSGQALRNPHFSTES